jgi:hypothetical protein
MIVDYRGFTWEETGGGGEALLNAVGLVDAFGGPLTANTATNEYTWIIEGWNTGTPLSEMTTPGFVDITGGTFRIYEDDTPDADYGVNPPNATVPATFTDGTLYLSGTFQTLRLWWDPTAKLGNFDGTIVFDGGSHLAEVDPSANRGWTFGATTSSPYAQIPQGYFQAMLGEIFLIPLAIEPASWGSIKALYAEQ